jgi:lipopolysaccharide/colanic/teichoic acid biosynthesis glycosyltransferase
MGTSQTQVDGSMNDLRTALELEPSTPICVGAISNWCSAPGKRALDLLCTIPALAALVPVMLVIGAGVKLTSGGPVLFRQKRFGRNGCEFECIKFRTMKQSPGLGVTQAGDARVTRLGRMLRKWKLDELPQFINVVRGDMTLVGPRPDLPEFISELDTPRRNGLALLTPGITGWATLKFRHEEELLADIPPDELRSFYIRQVLPRKSDLDLDYASRASFWGDVMILFRTVAAIF